jgi:hypothetical protein
MRVIVQFTKREETKAIPILYRHSQGMVLRNRIYVIRKKAAQKLVQEGIRFKEIAREFEELRVSKVPTGKPL